MKKSIWKFDLSIQSEVQGIGVPVGSELLKVAMQGRYLCVWFKVDTTEERKEVRSFFVVGTGHEFYDKETEYVDTIVMQPGDGIPSLVWHIFEVI